MMDEQGTRFEVLLEDVDRKLGALAEAVAVVDARTKRQEGKLDGLESRFGELTFEVKDLKKTVSQISTKVDRLEVFATDTPPRLERIEGKVDKLEGKVDKLEGKVDKLEEFATDASPRLIRLEAFASDAAPRLVRIETHLALPAPRPRRETTKLKPSKHRRRKPMKRN